MQILLAVAAASLTFWVSFNSALLCLSPYCCFSQIPSLPLSPQEKNLEWFPRMRAISLVSSEGDNEQNEMRSLQDKLDGTVTLVSQLSGQLAELKEQVQCHSSTPFQAVSSWLIVTQCFPRALWPWDSFCPKTPAGQEITFEETCDEYLYLSQ